MVERFPHAPILEALLDIRVKFPSGVDSNTLRSFHDTIRDRYPTSQERIRWEGRMAFQAGDTAPDVHASGSTLGYQFSSSDGRQIAQARLDGFSLSRLRPYLDWASFRDEAHRLWQQFVTVLSPEMITRVALRFINRILIPLPIADLKDYLLTAPDIVPGLPQAMSNFFMRLVVPAPGNGSVAIITETMEEVTGDMLPLIFDIDVFRDAAFPTASDEAWREFEALHDFKNEIFFKSVTEKAKELFR